MIFFIFVLLTVKQSCDEHFYPQVVSDVSCKFITVPLTSDGEANNEIQNISRFPCITVMSLLKRCDFNGKLNTSM